MCDSEGENPCSAEYLGASFGIKVTEYTREVIEGVGGRAVKKLMCSAGCLRIVSVAKAIDIILVDIHSPSKCLNFFSEFFFFFPMKTSQSLLVSKDSPFDKAKCETLFDPDQTF